jgi:chromate transporter
LDLVILFAQVGMSAVGGQVAVHLWTRLVRRNGLNEQEYLEAMNWSQCVPGCNGTNLSAYLGWRFGRSLGAVLATIALLIPGAIGLIFVSTVLSMLPQQHVIQSILASVTAAVVGLLFGMIWKLGRASLTQGSKWFVMAIAVLLVGILRLPILPVLILLGGLSWMLDTQDRQDDDHSA